MAQILTYPFGAYYTSSSYSSQAKDGKGGSIPTSTDFYNGKVIQTTNGVQWWGSSEGSDNFSTANSAHEQWNGSPSSGNKGLHFWMNTSSNGKQIARWFDIGAEAGKAEGVSCSSTSRSSYVREATGLAFMFNAFDTTTTRDCYARVERVALRYRDHNGRHRIRVPTTKKGDLSIMEGLRGSSRKLFAYQLKSFEGFSDVMNHGWHLLGCRIQIQLRRGANGTTTDTIQGGITGLRFMFGDCSRSFTSTVKQVLVPSGNTTWGSWNQNNFLLETR